MRCLWFVIRQKHIKTNYFTILYVMNDHRKKMREVIDDLDNDWRNVVEHRLDRDGVARSTALRRVYIRTACAQVVPKNGIEVMNEWKWHTRVKRLKRYLRENNVDTSIKDKRVDLIRRLMSL